MDRAPEGFLVHTVGGGGNGRCRVRGEEEEGMEGKLGGGWDGGRARERRGWRES